MKFFADLHIHSRFSRATSRQLGFRDLAVWARKKGLQVAGTGDFTHPVWRKEIREQLEPDGSGLFRPGKTLAAEVRHDTEQLTGPAWDGAEDVRFILQSEISTIYKRAGRTRKIHHLCFLPGLDEAERFCNLLSRRGNLASDGRPIIGMDSRDLFSMLLESSDKAMLIPAHIWTPWFSLFGSQSGFDSIEECYGELAGRITALETGLSSDPVMNRRLSALDRFRLVSNSDAHSASKLGREATVFEGVPGYEFIRTALAGGEGYYGTVEFYPEEGKYHADGHRLCKVRLQPEETLACNGRCPVCGGQVTVGVSSRIQTLADRTTADAISCEGCVSRMIPLQEIIAEIMGMRAASQKVQNAYEEILRRLGPELMIMDSVSIDRCGSECGEILAEAVNRMRSGVVIRDAGFDGQFGVIRLFRDGETAAGKLFPDNAPGGKRLPSALRNRRKTRKY
jgi:DNA helicase II / ATP-dependent DNA helicase PcrA